MIPRMLAQELQRTRLVETPKKRVSQRLREVVPNLRRNVLERSRPRPLPPMTRSMPLRRLWSDFFIFAGSQKPEKLLKSYTVRPRRYNADYNNEMVSGALHFCLIPKN